MSKDQAASNDQALLRAFYERGFNLGSICDLSQQQKNLTASDLEEQILHTMGHLRKSGLKKGHRVLLFMCNSVEFYIHLLALWALDVCVAPVGPFYTDEDINEFSRLIGATHSLLSDGLHSNGKISSTTNSNLSGSVPFGESARIILFTSGSTRTPKAVAHSLEAVAEKFKLLRSILPTAEFERTLCLLPTHFSHGLISNSLFPLLSGCHLHIDRPFFSENLMRFGPTIDEHQITFVSSVPYLWEQALHFSVPPNGSSLRRVHCGSTKLSYSLAQRVLHWIHCKSPQARLFHTYGTTETLSWISGHEVTAEYDEGNVGSGWGARFQTTEESEVLVYPSLQIHTHDHNQASKETFLPLQQDGSTSVVFATRDIGKINSSGELTLSGRLDFVINRGGVKVSPEDIETAARQITGTKDAVCIGLPDSRLGEAIVLLIETSAASGEAHRTLSEEELVRFYFDHLQGNLASFKLPDRIFITTSIPRNTRGKPDRKAIRERYASI
ncbi:MAG: class I adenylate-forming enzyme family protein [Bdellovibrionales bacterium]|jgi:acyl-CoA synthetase (AMP-forming)/AMP-acid ligase II|nr:class I adenylate-forming enzyme family protein [Bdellovibrionales bacterium]